MIRIRDLTLSPGQGMGELLTLVARTLRIKELEIGHLTLAKKSIDARKKQDIRVTYTVDVVVHQDEAKLLKRLRNPKITIAKEVTYDIPQKASKNRPVVVGFGPGGMFAALVLAEAGLCPIVLERGDDVHTRQKKVESFWAGGPLDENSNVQFGAGGAGTFSDGKLNTGIKNHRISWILKKFVEFGAKEDILWDAKPHIGTDRLVDVVDNLERHITALGATVSYGCKLSHLDIKDGQIQGVSYESQGKTHHIPCDHVILAIGHSARDTFRQLLAQEIPMEPKPFAMGVRIEHLQSEIQKAQYGDAPLPPADYKMVAHLEDRTVYTFCMCPGGYVVASSSQGGGVVTNGMSYQARAGKNANSALLVSLNPSDFPSQGILGGMEWQEQLEQAAFAHSHSYKAPAQTVGDFLSNRPTSALGTVAPTYQPGVTLCNLRDILPATICDSLAQALPLLGRKLKGFDHPDALLTAPETRSSSPVRILRFDDGQSQIRGLYPCGEGAGYAGGITSAACDGMKQAEQILQQLP